MITVDSIIGEGTTFNLYSPKIENRILEIIEETNPLPYGYMKVLVVDDENARG